MTHIPTPAFHRLEAEVARRRAKRPVTPPETFHAARVMPEVIAALERMKKL